jgi:branched-chain amino acid transport system permease protein
MATLAKRSPFGSSKKTQEMIQWILFVGFGLLLVATSGLSGTAILQATVNGILVGGVYSLVALGIVIINKATGIFNFSHGLMMLFGGLMFWQGFNSTPSQELSLILAGLTCLSALMLFADNIKVDTKTVSPGLEGLFKSLQTNDRLLSLGGGVVGAIAAIILLNLPQSTLLEGALGLLVGFAIGYILLHNIVIKTGHLYKLVTKPRFVMVATIGLVAGAGVYLLLQNIPTDEGILVNILRGVVSGYIGSLSLGLIVDRFTIRPLLGQPTIAAIMMTLAVALLLQGFISLIWGAQPRSLPVFVDASSNKPTLIQTGIDAEGNPIYLEVPNTTPPRPLPNFSVDLFGLLDTPISLQRNLVWGFGVAITGFMMFVLFFQFTSTGLAMRAVAENQVLAESVGLQVRTILAVAWAIATTMAMVAAVIQGMGPGVGLSTLVIPPLAFRAFPAVLLGGLESITGALVGGLIIGIVETLASVVFDTTTGQEFAPFAVLLVVLLIRPDGLFGLRRIDRV